MPGLVPTVLRASLACALGVGTSGCGAVDEARARLDALLGDEDAPATAPADAPAPEASEAPVVVARAGEADGEASGAGSDRDAPGAGTGDEAAGGGSGTTGPADPTGDTGLLPMSYARPPVPPTSDPPEKGSGDEGGATAGAEPSGPPPGPAVTPPATPDPTVPTTPPSSPLVPPLAPVSACLEGEWDAEDLHTYFRRDLLEQAHGRTVRHRGESGRYRLRVEAGVLHGKAEHRRMTFSARLANVDIRYTVDVHGELEAAIRSESPDVLVVDRPTRNTLRVREVVRFSADKSETRALELPVEGRWQVACTPGTLELRPLEDGKPGPALRFVRPKP